MRLANVAPLAFLGTLAAATMDVKVIANSCAGPYFEKAVSAPGNPCPPGNFDCLCGAGFAFMSQYLIQALSANPGACPGNQLLELQDKAKMACGGSGGAPPTPGATTPPFTTPMMTPIPTPTLTPNVTVPVPVPTGIFPGGGAPGGGAPGGGAPSGNVTPPAGTPTSPSVYTGAAATAAIGQFVGAAGFVAAAVAFGL